MASVWEGQYPGCIPCFIGVFVFAPHVFLPSTAIGCPVLIGFTWLLLTCSSSCMKVRVSLCSCQDAWSGLIPCIFCLYLSYFVFGGFVCLLLRYEFDLLRLQHLNIGHNSVKGHFVSIAAVLLGLFSCPSCVSWCFLHPICVGVASSSLLFCTTHLSLVWLVSPSLFQVSPQSISLILYSWASPHLPSTNVNFVNKNYDKIYSSTTFCPIKDKTMTRWHHHHVTVTVRTANMHY